MEDLYLSPKSIKVYRSHIEVYPYTQGDCLQIEKMYSKWDDVTHSYIRIGYFIYDNTLYLPRGTSLGLLSQIFNSTPILVNKSDPAHKLSTPISMKYEPRDKIQEESINFLTFSGNFTKGLQHSQFALNLDTGMGKTFCMISAIAKHGLKAIIILHKTNLKQQWIDSFIDKTDISEDLIMDIDGSSDIDAIMTGKKSADIYLVNHQTLTSYAKNNSWEKLHLFFKKIAVGIKVIDEAHKYFQNSLMLDFFSDVKLSYYLTATFSRSDPKEIRIFQKAYASLYRFGEETSNYDEVRKHIVLCVILYRSNPDFSVVNKIVNGAYGFNSYKYIDYTLKQDTRHTMMKVIKKVIDKVEPLEGKILITSPKIESVELIAKELKYETDKTIGVVCSKYSSDENREIIKNSDIISSTIKGIGEGDDIKGLRVIINTEPVGSKVLVDQLKGRLREYSKDEDTYLFYLIDTSIGYTYEMFKRVKSVFDKKCKEINMIRLDV
jgi:superfamily II DNA or RNA helicase